MYSDHCMGKKHKKREREAKIYDCAMCGIFCITAHEQRLHFESALHRESIEVREYLASQKMEQDARRKAEGSQILDQKDLNDLKLDKNSNKVFKVCELCNVSTNSKQMWDSHAVSKKHKAKELDAEMNKKKIALQFSCTICKVLCYSAEEREAHLRTEKHSEGLRERFIQDSKTCLEHAGNFKS